MTQMISCCICGYTESSDDPPSGWATGYASFCSAACLRSQYKGLSIAVIFPADATPEEHRALRDHEDELFRRTLDANPKMIGALAGSLFRQREERDEARRKGTGSSSRFNLGGV